MKKKWFALLEVFALVIFASGCAPVITATPVAVTETPTDSGAENCYFNWASKSLPDLSAQVQDAIRQLQPEAEAIAQAYGENCTYEDGHSTFSAMETDFIVTLQVNDLKNADDLGNWIKQTMTVLNRFPPDQTPGPQPGQVTLQFQSGSDQLSVAFSISDYQKLSPNLSNAEIYQALSSH